MTKLSSLLLLSITLFFQVACTQDETLTDREALTMYLDEERDQQAIPALATLVFKEDNVLYEYYGGQAQVADDVELNADHSFLLASVSKMVTGVALLQLYDQGLLDLDDPINDHLPFAVNSPGQSTDITVRMLLTHTSGIADNETVLDGQYYDNQDSPVDLASFMEDYFVPGRRYYNASQNFHSFVPGTEHEYSNTGSALIAVLVEHRSGMGFNAYCKQHIFQPLGMIHTAWRLDELNNTLVQPYEYINGDWEELAHYTFTDYPNGGLRSTPRDLFRFMRAFVQGGTSGGYTLLQPSTAQAMMRPQIGNLDATTGLHAFNYGGRLWGHDGSEKGVSTMMAVDLESKVGAIVLTNETDAEVEPILKEAIETGKQLE